MYAWQTLVETDTCHRNLALRRNSITGEHRVPEADPPHRSCSNSAVYVCTTALWVNHMGTPCWSTYLLIIKLLGMQFLFPASLVLRSPTTTVTYGECKSLQKPDDTMNVLSSRIHPWIETRHTADTSHKTKCKELIVCVAMDSGTLFWFPWLSTRKTHTADSCWHDCFEHRSILASMEILFCFLVHFFLGT